MPKILDLSALPTRDETVIVIGDERHVMQPMTVGRFIEQQKLAKKIDETGDLIASLETVISLIADNFPTLTVEKLQALPIDVLNQILQFAMGQGEEAAAEGNGKGAAS